MRKAIMVFAVLCASTMLSGTAEAEAPRSIVGMGCHLNDKTCYVILDGAPFGPESCMSTWVRWREDAANGKAALALLTSAFLSEKKVRFHLSDTCFANQPTYPTFMYFWVE